MTSLEITAAEGTPATHGHACCYNIIAILHVVASGPIKQITLVMPDFAYRY